jgi:hypothetical protein
MSTIYVTAAPGSRVPQENHPRRYYPAHDEAAMGVADTAHLRRLIVLGDLVLCTAPAPILPELLSPMLSPLSPAADVEVQ